MALYQTPIIGKNSYSHLKCGADDKTIKICGIIAICFNISDR